ncbi:hypothetical protein B0H11DRAFT_2109220 [Mycena galericulata]|nr:hypothetical protein B0H11DRAFT_2109220 [Mycena galericulata]
MWIFWLVYDAALSAMGTINLACSIRYNENAWVNDREYPGGPYSYLIGQQSVPFMTLGNTASILAAFMSNGLLLYRAGVLWNFAWYMFVPPASFFVACSILSVMAIIKIAIPTVPLPELAIPVWIVLVIIPIWLTALIAGRILYHRQTMINVLGPRYAKRYASTSAIVIESAVPYTVISLILLGLYGSQNIAQNLFTPLLVQVECIAPELIILRVVLGRSWTKGTMSGEGKPSDIHFASPRRQDTEGGSDDAALAAALGTQSTWSRSNETPRRNSTTTVVLRDADHDEEEKKDDNASDSSVNVF